MTLRQQRVVIMVVGLTVLVLGWVGVTTSAQSFDWNILLKQTLPAGDRFTQMNNIAVYKAKDLTKAIFPAYQGASQIGVVFYSAPYGYKSYLHTLVALDMKGTVIRVNVFNHDETPSYVVPLDNGTFLRQFNGITLSDRLSFIIGGKATKRGDIVSIADGTATAKPIAIAVSEARKLFVEIYGTP